LGLLPQTPQSCTERESLRASFISPLLLGLLPQTPQSCAERVAKGFFHKPFALGASAPNPAIVCRMSLGGLLRGWGKPLSSSPFAPLGLLPQTPQSCAESRLGGCFGAGGSPSAVPPSLPSAIPTSASLNRRAAQSLGTLRHFAGLGAGVGLSDPSFGRVFAVLVDRWRGQPEQSPFPYPPDPLHAFRSLAPKSGCRKHYGNTLSA